MSEKIMVASRRPRKQHRRFHRNGRSPQDQEKMNPTISIRLPTSPDSRKTPQDEVGRPLGE
jgi:hypothetical protein